MSSLGVGDRVNRDYAKNVKAAHAEETVLGLMLLFPEYTEQVRSGKTELTEDDFVTEFNRRVFRDSSNAAVKGASARSPTSFRRRKFRGCRQCLSQGRS